MDMDEDSVRTRLRQRLADGLKTEVEPRAYDSDEVRDLITRLQALPSDDYDRKLVVAGMTLAPYLSGEPDDDLTQSCETCMYFVTHRRFCDLPELRLPVEKDWSCRLWRI